MGTEHVCNEPDFCPQADDVCPACQALKPKPPVEPDKPFTLHLTRSDGSTVEVRTRLEWCDDSDRDSPLPLFWCTEGGSYSPRRNAVSTGSLSPDTFLRFADDLRTIREAMGVGE